MSRTVTTTVADLRVGLTSLSGAWAAWRDAACNAQLAAVMGPSLSRHLRFGDEYSAADSVASDYRLRREIDKASGVAPGLLAAVERHIEWVVQEAREGIEADMTLSDPKLTLDATLIAIADRIKMCEDEQTRVMANIESKLKEIEAEA